MFEVGKLYKCPEYYLLSYPNEEIATDAQPAAPTLRVAEYWLEYYNCRTKVRYINPNDIFMCLKLDKEVMQVLCGEHVGWILIEDWLQAYIEKVGQHV